MDRILVADSSPRVAEIIAQCLISSGYTVLTAESGYQILAKTQLFNPDLVILDTHFNDMSGYDVCKKIKANPNSQYSLVLFLSSLETKESKIKAFEAGADDIMEKNFDALVLAAKVGSLLRITHLRSQLEEQFIELQKKDNALNFQLKMSQQIQRSIMKDYDMLFNGLHIMTKYLPALDIGGDFYDIITLDQDKLMLCIGDVSGHGISAALLTTMLSTMVKTAIERSSQPDKMLNSINNQFCATFSEGEVQIFICLFCALIDTRSKKITYSNAGQVYPVYFNSTENEATELNSTGMPIGMMQDVTYEYKEINYSDNDIFLFYTDGLADAFYKDSPDEFLSELYKLLSETNNIPNLRDIQNAIIDIFCELNPSQNKKFVLDDASLVLLRVESGV